MISLLDDIGPAIWRASWQATVLALLVMLLLRCFGDRLSPRWRFLLWGVVLTRMLIVAIPGSPWSMFNLARWNSEPSSPPMVYLEVEMPSATSPQPSPSPAAPAKVTVDVPQESVAANEPSRETPATTVAETTSSLPSTLAEAAQPLERPFDVDFVIRILSSIWLAGALVLGVKLLATAHVLRRRFSACRPVTDAAVLNLLQECRSRIGLKSVPALLVTPESLSPCIVGTLRSKIVLPESVVTHHSTEQLRRVLAHELAHLVRGDLWTNWLLLIARVLHWFNPIAWWTVREMQAEREAACDELACAAIGESDRSAYAATIVELAASLVPSAIAPGLIGLFSSTCRVKARIERLLRAPSAKSVRAPIALGMLLALILIGLTDAMPGVRAEANLAAEDPLPTETSTPPSEKEELRKTTHTLHGRSVNHTDRAPLAGITVKLYRVEGRTSPPVEIAKTVTNADGRYTFERLEPPREMGNLDRLEYVAFGFANDRPIGVEFFHFSKTEKIVDIHMSDKQSTLTGTVTDVDAKPVAGATVTFYSADRRPVPGFPSATTDEDGRFKLDNVPIYESPRGKGELWIKRFAVSHPDYPESDGKFSTLPSDVLVTLQPGCALSGTVTDTVTGKPATGAVIMARREDESGESFAETDNAGRFRFVVPEGRYDVLVEAKNRVCVASTGHDCLAGEKLELPPLELINGGLISGQVINTATGQPVAVSEQGGPIMLGFIGPSYPAGRVISQTPMTAVDATGRFTMRAAPGKNFPYFVNTHGQRMAWDTQQQPVVVVQEGETTKYDMLITPPVSAANKLKAARKLVDSLPKKPTERTEQILAEFRKLGDTTDHEELWCLLMRELVKMGRNTVPQVCAELDRTTEDRAIRRLAFALRAIGDPRAVPALIRAIPTSLVSSSSDYGLLVNDEELAAFMRAHDLNQGNGGTYFDFGRPPREIVGTLHLLTGQNFDDAQILSMHLSEDPRRQAMQRRVYARHAQKWQAWWEANWKSLTDDGAFHMVNLKVADEPLPAASQALGTTSRVVGEWQGLVISPGTEGGEHIWNGYDLDTGFRPNWPDNVSRENPSHDARQLAEWASQSGVDLICTTYRSPDGTDSYVLQALGMKVREINARDVRNLDRLITTGKIPEGRSVEGLLMHYDGETQQYVPDANAAFLFTTREGNMGLIEVTDRITRTADLTGMPSGNSPSGVGFHKGVKFNLKAIIP